MRAAGAVRATGALLGALGAAVVVCVGRGGSTSLLFWRTPPKGRAPRRSPELTARFMAGALPDWFDE